MDIKITTKLLAVSGTATYTLPEGTRKFTIIPDADVNFRGTESGGDDALLPADIELGPMGSVEFRNKTLYFNGTANVSIVVEEGSGY